MPRRPLAEISPNKASNHELSPYLRGKIERSRDLGQKCDIIAKTLKLAPSTVSYTLAKSTQRSEGHTLLRSGRPRLYTERDSRRIVRFVRVHPKSTYEDIRQNLHIYLSHDTFGRILAGVGIKNWRAKRRPFLTPEHAIIRQAWAKLRGKWSVEWDSIIFSDECSVERGAGAQREWVFRLPSQKWDKEMVQPYKSSKDISIMVWGAIWKGGRSDLVIMTRDEASPRGGYSANSYIDILDEQMPICYEPGRIFMQDNARIHTAKKVKSWFKDNAILLLEWPPYSPDMNPIENLWAKMKESIIKHHPELSNMGKSAAAMEAISKAIIEAWEALPQEYIDNLIDGMPKRVEALKEARGWHTKY